MSSDKQIEANRENARKSTGPKTEEGKERSRQNAFKHGMSGGGEGVLLPPEDLTLFQERFQEWTNDARPEGPLEVYLLGRAAFASVRADRCDRHEIVVIKRKRAKAIDAWESAQASKIQALVNDLAENPAQSVGGLCEFTRGCEWLQTRWNGLKQALDDTKTWNAQQCERASHLLAATALSPAASDADRTALRAQMLAVRTEIDLDEADQWLDIGTGHLPIEARREAVAKHLPQAAEAVAALVSVAIGGARANPADPHQGLESDRLAGTRGCDRSGDVRRQQERRAQAQVRVGCYARLPSFLGPARSEAASAQGGPQGRHRGRSSRGHPADPRPTLHLHRQTHSVVPAQRLDNISPAARPASRNADINERCNADRTRNQSADSARSRGFGAGRGRNTGAKRG